MKTFTKCTGSVNEKQCSDDRERGIAFVGLIRLFIFDGASDVKVVTNLMPVWKGSRYVYQHIGVYEVLNDFTSIHLNVNYFQKLTDIGSNHYEKRSKKGDKGRERPGFVISKPSSCICSYEHYRDYRCKLIATGLLEVYSISSGCENNRIWPTCDYY